MSAAVVAPPRGLQEGVSAAAVVAFLRGLQSLELQSQEGGWAAAVVAPPSRSAAVGGNA